MKPKTVNKDKNLNSRNRFIGVLPEKWQVNPLDQVAEVKQGVSKGRNFKDKKKIEVPYLRVANVLDGEFDLSEIKTIEVLESEFTRYNLKTNDILITEGGDPDKLGRGSIWKDQIQGVVYQNHLFRIRCIGKSLSAEFLAQYIQGRAAKNYFLSCAKQTTGIASINLSQIRTTPIPVPPLAEQRKIAAILSAWDEAIQTARQLLEARQLRKSALMQKLLTGQTRLPGFIVAWQEVKIKNVAHEISKRNKANKPLTVLSCTKYKGLVDSLEYFGRKIYSDDLTGYKVVPAGCFAYATNHIEEGSIGYQQYYKEALISPMYTVFKTDNSIDDTFFYMLLKTDWYVKIYQKNMMGSINRRGGLRWADFSTIKVSLPPLEEQRAIATVLNAADEEIRLSTEEIEVLKEQKSGLMQQLLTGKTRVRTEV